MEDFYVQYEVLFLYNFFVVIICDMESKLWVLEIIGKGEIFGFESIIVFEVYGKGFYIGFSDYGKEKEGLIWSIY